MNEWISMNGQNSFIDHSTQYAQLHWNIQKNSNNWHSPCSIWRNYKMATCKIWKLRYLWFNKFRLSKGPHLGSALPENRIYGGQIFGQAWRALQIHLNDCGKNLKLHTLSHTFIAPGYTVNTLSVFSSAKSGRSKMREK